MKKWMCLLAAMIWMAAVPFFPGCAEGQDTYLSSKIAAGKHHAAAILWDGTVTAAGDNTFGQCDVEEWENVIALAAGDGHTVGLRKDGTVVANGRNDYGQCNVEAWQDIVKIACGDEHTVGLKKDGTVVATGNRGYTQRYDDEPLDPCAVEKWQNIVEIAAGGHSTFAMDEKGHLMATGDQLDDPEAFTGSVRPEIPRQIAVMGDKALLALYSDGTLSYSGSGAELYPDEWFLCGHCIPGIDKSVYGNPHAAGMWKDLVAISASDDFLLGLKKDGSVVAAGDYAAAEAGYSLHGTEEWKDIVAISVGGDFALGVDKNGRMHYIAQPTGEMGGVKAWKGARSASASFDVAMALDEEGMPMVWSAEETLYLLGGDVRVEVKGWRNLDRLLVSETMTAGLTKDGRVLAACDWDGDLLERLEKSPPAKDISLSLDRLLVLEESGNVVLYAGDSERWDLSDFKGARQVAMGKECAFALMEDGTVRVSGGQLQGALDTWRDIAFLTAAEDTVYGLKEDGTVVIAGECLYGQDEALAWTDIVSLSASPYHVAGVRGDGSAVAAGLDETGEREPGWELESKYQCQVGHWRDVESIVAGMGCTIGIQKDGSILLAGMGHVDVSPALEWQLFHDEYVRNDAPLATESQWLTGIARDRMEYDRDRVQLMNVLYRFTPAMEKVLAQHPEYDYLYHFHQGVAVFRRDGLYGLVDEEGKEIMPARNIQINRHGDACIFWDGESRRIGFYRTDTKTLIPAQFYYANDFEGDYAEVSIREKEMYVDKYGNLISDEVYAKLEIPETAPKEKLLHVYVQKDLEEWGEGEYGYTNASGSLVIPPIFDMAHEFEGDLARAWLWGSWGVIDSRGNPVSGFEEAWDIIQNQ